MVHDTPGSIVEAEREAIRRCQAGEADAFRVVVERHGNVLFGTAYLMLRDRGQAEDAVQDAFVSGWTAISAFDIDRPLRPWLLRILVNHVLQRRRRKFLRLIPLGETESTIASSEVGPELAAERAWERQEIRAALATLPADAARVVVLRFFAELSVAEVAETLDVPTGTVKSRLHRALQKLRVELDRRAAARRQDTGARQDREAQR